MEKEDKCGTQFTAQSLLIPKKKKQQKSIFCGYS